MVRNFYLVAFAATLVAGGLAQAQTAEREPGPPKSEYKRDLPDSLMRLARVKELDAAMAARQRVPRGKVQAVELERENGRLIYSYELKVAGKKGVEEINVDALTGAVVSHEHESPAAEKKETAAEKKEPKRKP